MSSIQPVSEVRTQIYLPKTWHQQLKEKAKHRGVSLAAVIREAVRSEIEEPKVKDREEGWKQLMKMAGFIKDKHPIDISKGLGHYRAQLVWEKMQRQRKKK